MLRISAFSFLIILLLFACSEQTREAPKEVAKQPLKYVIVKWKADYLPKAAGALETTEPEIAKLRTEIGVERWEPLMRGVAKPGSSGMERIGRLYYSQDLTEQQVVDLVNRSGLVEYAEVDQQVHTQQK